MLLVILSFMVGAAGGAFVRSLTVRTHIARVTQAIGFVLLFVIGISLGADNAVWTQAGAIGWIAAVITFFNIAGSVTASYLYDKLISGAKV